MVRVDRNGHGMGRVGYTEFQKQNYGLEMNSGQGEADRSSGAVLHGVNGAGSYFKIKYRRFLILFSK